MMADGWRRYGAFFLLALALGLAPGPDILFVFAQSVSQGLAAGSLVTLGLCTGLCVHVALAAFGAAALLERHPRAVAIVTWCGALYLLWLGVSAWRAGGIQPVGADGLPVAEALSPIRLYLRGVVLNLCNPKIILFFLALTPRFTRPEKGRVALQFVLLGILFIVATLIVFNGVSAAGDTLARMLARWPDAPRILQRFSALVLWGVAAWIGWTNR